ncbi:MAG: L-threonylcarbamoyladenylate synthase [Myxococcales bacterium]
MVAPILTIDPEHPQPRLIERAVSALQAGELIAYPTDSYYGLGCDMGSKRAIDRLYQLKGHDRKRPMSLLVPDLSDLAQYAKVSNHAYRILKHLAPGPFTFVLEATRLVPEIMQTKQKTVGLRISEHPVAHALCAALGRPLVTTSAAMGEQIFIGADEIRDGARARAGAHPRRRAPRERAVDGALAGRRPAGGAAPGQGRRLGVREPTRGVRGQAAGLQDRVDPVPVAGGASVGEAT